MVKRIETGLRITPAAVLDTVDRVAGEFPFPGYVSAGVRHGLAHIIPEIARHCEGAAPELLDIGSGPMDKTAVFQGLGFRCFAVDDLSDPWHLRGDNRQRIEKFARRQGIVFHRQSDGDYSIPFEMDRFDVATIFDVIEHLHESPRSILNAAGVHLRTGGLLAVTMPNAVNLRKRVSVLRGSSNYPPVDQFFLSCGGWRGHVREYTLPETVYLCEAAGFEVLSATTYEGNAYDKLSGLRLAAYLQISKLVPTFRSGLCVVARKPVGWWPRAEDAEAFRRVQLSSVPEAVA